MGGLVSRAWEAYKTHSTMFLVLSCAALGLFGLFFCIGGAYLGATNTTLTEIGAGVLSGVVGAFMVLSALLGFVVMRSRKPAPYFAFTAYTLALFLAELVLIVYVLTLIQRVGSLSTPTLYSANITDATTRVVSDFVYSTYVTCCTGCVPSVCGRTLNSTTYCDQTLPTPRCAWVYPCSVPAGSNSKVCFWGTRNASAPTAITPPFDVSASLCDMLRNAGWGATNKPVVGDIGVDSAGISSCGAGVPQTYALAMSDWLSQQYGWVSAIVGIVLFVELVAASAAWAATRHAIDNDRDPRRKDQLRPFG